MKKGLRFWKKKLSKSSGYVILVEKTQPSKTHYSQLFQETHNQFREQNSYIKKEIANKKKALRHILQPLSAQEIKLQIIDAGFSECQNLWQWGNFCAWIIKS